MTFNQMQQFGRNLTVNQINSISKAIAGQYSTASSKLKAIVMQEYNTLKKAGKIKSPDDFVKLLKQSGRDKVILAKSKKIMDTTLKVTNATVINSSLIAMNNNYYAQQYAFSWFTPLSTSKQLLDFTFIDPIAVQMSTFGTEGIWDNLADKARKERLAGFRIAGNRPTLTNLLLKNNKRTVDRIKKAITNGYVKGVGVNQIVADIRRGTDISANEMRRIVATETHRNINAGQYASYLDAKEQGVGSNRVVHAILDSKTRQQSATVDGRKDIYEGNKFAYPDGYRVQYPGNSGVSAWDINDREYTTVSIDGVPDGKRIARNPENGLLEEAEYNDFDDWRKSNGLVYKQGKLVPKG